jgi:subtilase family serine protease
MSPKKEDIISAQVVLRPASGKSVTGQEAITSDNVRDYMPSPESFQAVASEFAAAGFEVSAAGPTGFSITAPASTFEKFFNTRLKSTESGGVESVGKDKSTGYELPLRGLPKGLSHHIEAVTFTPPPDFGPTSFY